MRILIYSQKLKDSDIPYIKELLQVAYDENMEISLFGPYAEALKTANVIDKEYPILSTYEEIKADMPDMVYTMGGDGTILGAILYIRDLGIPILGVNLGRLGFLSNVEKSRIRNAVQATASGSYTLEHRTMMTLESNIPVFGDTPFCLNDFTITKRD